MKMRVEWWGGGVESFSKLGETCSNKETFYAPCFLKYEDISSEGGVEQMEKFRKFLQHQYGGAFLEKLHVFYENLKR